jgi:hypothetical protein
MCGEFPRVIFELTYSQLDFGFNLLIGLARARDQSVSRSRKDLT